MIVGCTLAIRGSCMNVLELLFNDLFCTKQVRLKQFLCVAPEAKDF